MMRRAQSIVSDVVKVDEWRDKWNCCEALIERDRSGFAVNGVLEAFDCG